MRSSTRKALLSLATLPVAGVLALSVVSPASAGPFDGVANITVEGETINVCRYSSVSAIADAINNRTSDVTVTPADVTEALGTSNLTDFQRDNCRRGDRRDDNDRRRGTTGTTVVDCDEDGEVRILESRYRDLRDRYNRYYNDRYLRDRSPVNLSVLRGIYGDYVGSERVYRERADRWNRERERLVVNCPDREKKEPVTVNNYQVVQAPPGGSTGGFSSSGSGSGGTTYRTPRGGAETGSLVG